MMRSLEKRGLMTRLLHTRPTVWYNVSWQNETPNLEPEQREGMFQPCDVPRRAGFDSNKGHTMDKKRCQNEQSPNKTPD